MAATSDRDEKPAFTTPSRLMPVWVAWAAAGVSILGLYGFFEYRVTTLVAPTARTMDAILGALP